MSTFDPEAVQDLLTPARLSSYRDAVGGGVESAVPLYDGNSAIERQAERVEEQGWTGVTFTDSQNPGGDPFVAAEVLPTLVG